MSTNPLLIVVKRLITQLIILSVATAIFVFYLIFGTTENENEKKNKEDTVALSNVNNAPESHQLVQYQPLKVNFVDFPKLIQFSIDLRDVLKLKSVQIDSNFEPRNQSEDSSERKEEKKKGYSMIISLQENLLIQRMNTFGE